MAIGRPRTFDTDDALNSAVDVFWSRGYDGASLDELTDAMNMNKFSLYKVFGSKEGLFREVVARYVDRDLAYAREALEEPTALKVAQRYLRANIEAVTRPGRPAGCLSIQGGLSCGPDSADMVELLAENRLAGEQAMVARFDRAVADGDLPDTANPAALARFLTTVAEGHAVHAAGGVARDELAESAEIALLAFRSAARRKRSSSIK
ncbi:MAG: TetR family transcriptional regulator [Pseudonocardiales bacterium]|jgi:AcrR family transcriptional regulator|nr:TetR family transcriptional regulator [Pseudonocardiales bacterium]